MSSENTDSEPDELYCTSCGEEIPSSASFCPECGAKQDADTVQHQKSSSESSSKEKSKLRHRFPGFAEGNTTRRNVITGGVYTVIGLTAIGTLTGSSEDDSGSSEDDSANSGGESYPNAFSYDESTEIVFEDGITAETDSIGSLYIRGTARNESDQDYSYVQVTWAVVDSSGAKIADALANTSGLAAGQRWRYEAVAASAPEADSFDLESVTAY
jgi:predicted RNA-binding Zn-ribbon protein involved in translation (DUF1610 family)